MGALQFCEPKLEVLRNVKDSEWETTLSSWQTGRLALLLRQQCGDRLPDWVRSRIDISLSDTALRFERIKSIYATAAKTFKELNLDHLVLKGFSLWPGYSEHPRFRPQSDIDVLCPKESIYRARDALAALGYEPELWQVHLPKDHLCSMSPKTSWKWHGNLFDPEIPVSFELHFCLWNESVMRFHLTGLEQFWTRRIIRQLDELSFPGLDPVDNVGYTSLNVLRDLFKGSPAPEQVYGLARFLHTHADDHAFWRRWTGLHEEPLRCLEAIAFCFASGQFACRLPEEVEEEMDRFPAPVRRWFRGFFKSAPDPRFCQARQGIWLHLNFLDSFNAKSRVLFNGLIAVPVEMRNSAPAPGDDFQSIDNATSFTLQKLLRSCAQRIKFAGLFVYRNAVRLPKLPFFLTFLWRGLRYRQLSIGLGKQFWKFLAASFCLDVGMTIFFFLYNLFLLDRGFKEEFLGAMTSAMSIGSIACTIPAGVLIERIGLRKSLLLCFALVPCVSAARVMSAPRSVLLALAFLAGFVMTIWAVALSPAITRLTNEKNRPLGFSLVFSTGIGLGVVGNLIASRMPDWFAHLMSFLTVGQAKQVSLLVGCATVALGLFPLVGLSFPSTPPAARKLYPRNPFLWRFLPAVALWSLVTGSLSPLANVYFANYLRTPLHQIGIVFSVASLFQVVAVLAAPLLFRKLGLVRGIASSQLATAVILVCLAAISSPASAAVIYIGYTGLLWMSEPGLFSLLMSRVSLAEQAGASALNFLVISLAQALAVATAGASFTRFGYPTVLYGMAGVALAAAFLFWLLLGRLSLPVSQRLPTVVDL